MIVDDYDPMAEKGFEPKRTVLLDEFNLPPAGRHVVDKMHVSFLNIGLQIISSGEVVVFIEEHDGAEWRVCDTTPTIPGETICSHRLKHPDFRIGVENPSGEAQTVSIKMKWVGPAGSDEL